MLHDDPVLSAAGLHISFPGMSDRPAVNNVAFSIGRGKTLAVVGESG